MPGSFVCRIFCRVDFADCSIVMSFYMICSLSRILSVTDRSRGLIRLCLVSSNAEISQGSQVMSAWSLHCTIQTLLLPPKHSMVWFPLLSSWPHPRYSLLCPLHSVMAPTHSCFFQPQGLYSFLYFCLFHIFSSHIKCHFLREAWPNPSI